MGGKLKILYVVWNVYSSDVPEMDILPNGGSIAIYDIADGVGEREEVTLFVAMKPLKGRELPHMRLADTESRYRSVKVPSRRELSEIEAGLCEMGKVFTPALLEHLYRMERVFEDELRTGGYDIVNIQGVSTFEVECVRICAEQNVKCVISDHLFIGDAKEMPSYEDGARHERVLFNMPGVAASVVSNGQKQKLLQHYPQTDPRSVSVIVNGIRLKSLDTEEEKMAAAVYDELRGFCGEKRLLVCVGTIQERKNQMQLVRAFSLLPQRVKDGLALVFCGKDGKTGDFHVPQLLQGIAERGLEDSLKYAGVFTPAQMQGLYRAADGAVLVSRSEGLSLALLESMHHGKPLIFYCDSECADDISDEKVVSFIEEVSDEAVAEAIVKWYDTEWDSEYIKRYARENFSRERMIRQYVELFREIAGKEAGL